MAKVLILAGDAAEDLETMFVKYRLVEAGHEPYVAAPTTRPIKLVVHDFEPDFDTYVEKPGRTCPVDVAFADVDPADFAAAVIPGGRAPEFITGRSRRAPHRRALLRGGQAGRHALPWSAGPSRPRAPARAALVRLSGARSGPRDGRSRVRRRRRCCRRKHGVVPRLGRPRRVVARVPRVPRSRCRSGVAPNRVVIPARYGRRLPDHWEVTDENLHTASFAGARDLVSCAHPRAWRHGLRDRSPGAEEQRRHASAQELRRDLGKGEEPLAPPSRLRVGSAARRSRVGLSGPSVLPDPPARPG